MNLTVIDDPVMYQSVYNRVSGINFVICMFVVILFNSLLHHYTKFFYGSSKRYHRVMCCAITIILLIFMVDIYLFVKTYQQSDVKQQINDARNERNEQRRVKLKCKMDFIDYWKKNDIYVMRYNLIYFNDTFEKQTDCTEQCVNYFSSVKTVDCYQNYNTVNLYRSAEERNMSGTVDAVGLFCYGVCFMVNLVTVMSIQLYYENFYKDYNFVQLIGRAEVNEDYIHELYQGLVVHERKFREQYMFVL